jgi:ribosomal protein L36
LGTIAVDGTKIKANASRHKAMSYERMQKAEAELKGEIDALLARASAVDESERNEPELDVPAEIARRENRLAVINAAKERLEQRQREGDAARGRTPNDERRGRGPDGTPKKGPRYKREFGTPKPEAQESFTDTDSRVMKRAGGGFDYSYNAFAAVDDQAHIIVAAELTNNAADSGQLKPLLEAVKDSTGELPAQLLADAGFRSEAQFEQLADSPVELIVALGREGKEQLAIDSAEYPRTAQMAAKLQTDEARAAYRRRKWLSEPPNGWVKNVLGFRQFSLRGLAKVKAEWRLVCTALNLRRMAGMMCG